MYEFRKDDEMKSILTYTSATAVAALLAAPALAGSANPAPVEPVVATPAPVYNMGGDWTGGYAGLSLGRLDVDGTGAADGDDVSYGIHGGYDYDFGRFVLGGEVEFEGTDIDLGGAADVDSVTRLKLRGGYDMGRTLLYVTAGAAEVDTSLGNETGAFGGFGMSYKITDRFTVGGEVLQHKFDDIGGSGVDADATSLNIRGGIRF